MQSTWTWAQVITSIKGVTARTSGGYSQSTTNKYGIDTSSGAWLYIPSNAYYTTGSWVNIPWNTIKGKLGAATTGEVLKDKTFSSSNGINIKGTIESKTSGNTSVTASGKWGIDTTNGMWMYIPSNAYYTTGHWLNVPWATCKSKIESFGSSNYPSGTSISAGDKDSYAAKELTATATVPSGVNQMLLVIVMRVRGSSTRVTDHITVSNVTLLSTQFDQWRVPDAYSSWTRTYVATYKITGSPSVVTAYLGRYSNAHYMEIVGKICY